MGLNFCDIANKKRESIASTISSYHQELVCQNRHILFKIIEVIILCGRQNIPLRGHVDQKSNFVSILNTIAKSDDILARHLAESKNPISETPESKTPSYMSPDIQNEIIDLCAKQIRSHLVKSCTNAPFFALLADETTDKSTKVQLSVCVRYIDVSDGNVTANENFLGFLHAKSTKAEPLADLLLGFMNEHDLPVMKLRAQGYDGASNMSGRKNGVQALIRQHAPEALYVHCKAHCLNLAIVHSCKEPCVRTMMATVQEVGFAFEYSAKRLECFKDELSTNEHVKDTMERTTKLKTLCETRWISRSDALTTFKQAFPVVIQAFEYLQNDHDDKAGLHLGALLRFEFLIGLVVCEHVLRLIVHLSFFLQDKSCDMLAAVEECRVVITQLRNERNDEAVWNALFDEAVGIGREFGIEPHIPRIVARQQNRANVLAANPSDYWRISLYNVFVDHLLLQLEDRLLGSSPRFEAFNLLPSRLNRLRDENIVNLYDTFSHDIIGDLDEFKQEIARWETRWAMAADKPSTLSNTVLITNKGLYPSIWNILLILLTMPVATATAERSFSVLRRIKNFLRTTMGESRLSSLGLMHIHREIDINVEDVVDEFAAKKNRKMDFIY